ncbi:MAG: NAD-dependent epimerase/dehydratase family protein [Ilumatobacteraceae bacterium]|nr:NAD-dependent epimerase/dehydratase family protein [Ilumatobacteraceae bacterium]
MRIVVVGATGNIGTATVRALAQDPQVTSIVGIARRLPAPPLASAPPPASSTSSTDELGGRVEWQAVDIEHDPLDVVAGADAVINLAWKLQPPHRVPEMDATNIIGARRLLAAVALHGVPALVCASSVGAYAPGPKFRHADGTWHVVDETWPATGVASSTYSTQKAAVEDMLDQFEQAHPATRVVRLRTSLVFQRDAASEIHRLFLGRLAPWHLPRFLRWIPAPERLVFQVTHADDIGAAYRLAATQDVCGPFNIAAEPVVTPQLIAEVVDGRTIRIPAAVLRWAAQATFRLRLQPTEGGWIDMAVGAPLMATTRARDVLGWTATISAATCIRELVDGIGRGAGTATAPLAPRTGPADVEEHAHDERSRWSTPRPRRGGNPMSGERATSEPSSMAAADVANGEQPQPRAEPPRTEHPTPPSPTGDDPDAPGLYVLDPERGDPVEPNEPA